MVNHFRRMTEINMANTFKNIQEAVSSAQLARLKKEYGKLKHIDWSKHKGQVKKTTAVLSKLKMDTLIGLSKEDIPLISDVAKSLVLKDKRFAHHVEEVQEADLSKSQVKMVHKKADELPKHDFIKRYGADGDAVRYATATNIVKKKLGIGEEFIAEWKPPVKGSVIAKRVKGKVTKGKVIKLDKADGKPAYWVDWQDTITSTLVKLKNLRGGGLHQRGVDYVVTESFDEAIKMNQRAHEIRELEFTFSNEQQAKKAEDWIEKSDWTSFTGGIQDIEQHKNTVWMGGITDPGGLEKGLKQSGFKFKVTHVDNRDTVG